MMPARVAVTGHLSRTSIGRRSRRFSPVKSASFALFENRTVANGSDPGRCSCGPVWPVPWSARPKVADACSN